MAQLFVLILFLLCYASPILSRRPQPYFYEYDFTKEHKFVNKTIKLSENAAVFEDDFLTAKKMKWRSFSQKGAHQDLVIDSIFNDKNNGYFVDLAANDWRSLSNTLMLEYFNDWRGICIEPSPEYLTGILSNRKCKLYTNPVSSAMGEKVNFSFHGAFSGIMGEEYDNKPEDTAWRHTELSTVTLESILDHAQAPSVIDYFSLDVEGAEYQVLRGFNFSRYTFLTVTVERPSSKVHQVLIRHGYRFAHSLCSFGEILYLHHTLPNFVEYMNKNYQQDVSFTWPTDTPTHNYFKHPVWTGAYVPVPSEIRIKEHEQHSLRKRRFGEGEGAAPHAPLPAA